MRATGASVLQGGDAEAALLELSTWKRTRERKRRSDIGKVVLVRRKVFF
jgi:hypothetical protein